MYKIDKNVPPPDKTGRGMPKYPFGDMAVGDSVLFEDERAGSQSSPATSARQYGLRNGVKFRCRIEGSGVRVWRIE